MGIIFSISLFLLYLKVSSGKKLAILFFLAGFPGIAGIVIAQKIGITVYYVICILIVLLYLFKQSLLIRKLYFSKPLHIPIVIFLCFLVWGIYSAIFFPAVFEGMLTTNTTSGMSSVTGITYSLSNLAQVGYLIISFIVLLSFSSKSDSYFNFHQIAKLLLLPLTILVLLSIWHFFSKISDIWYPIDFLLNMPERHGLPEAVVQGILPRASGSFMEASQISRYCVPFFAFYLYLSFFAPKYTYPLWGVLMSAIGIILSFSSVGLLSLIATLIAIFFMNIMHFLSGKKNNLLKKRQFYAIVIIFVSGGLIFVFAGTFVAKVFELLIFEKINTKSFYARTGSDLIVINTFFQSYGLGVGLGSVRPSSFIASLLGQVGIIGSVLFFSYGLSLFLVIKRFDNKIYGNSIFFAIFLEIIARSIGGPDLSEMALWPWLFFMHNYISSNNN